MKRVMVLTAFLLMGGVPARAAPGAAPQLVTQPSPQSPLVAIRLYFQVGAADDPPGKEGLAQLTAAMLGEGGTRQRTYAEVLDALYPMAAAIHEYGDKDGFVFEGTVHRDNLIAYADLLCAQILEPRFAEDDFKRNRDNAVDFLTKTLRGNDDENLGKQAFATRLYGAHPYGRPTAGTVAGLRAITLDDVKRFYQQRFTRDHLIVGVGGGYPDGFPVPFAARFARLPAHGAGRRPLPVARSRPGMDILIVEKDARANAISLGHTLQVTRSDDDFYPLAVAASYLGEHRTFNGVLMNEMRGKRGLNYGDYAYVENFIQDEGTTFPLPNIPRRQQHFEIWIRPVAPMNTVFALRHALFETDRLIKEGIPSAGFEATRNFLLNYSRLWTQDVSRRLGYGIDAVIYGKDIQAELQKRLPTMTKAEVDAAVRKHLTTGRLAVAIVSDKASDVRSALLSGQPSPITYDTKDTPREVMAKDKIVEKFPLPLTPARVQILKVERLFEK